MEKYKITNLIKPQKLKKGDTIEIIAPAGIVSEDRINNSVKYFEQLGFRVKLGKNIYKRDRYFAGTDEERLSDLISAFEDDEVNAILCARGGYGCIRLISKIDYNVIKNNSKIFCGYSDITALSLMFLKKAELITFSSPMPKSDFQPEDLDKITQESFFKTLENNETEISAPDLKIYKQGSAQGIMWGGNLATVVSLCGLDFIPDDKFIFFAEDVNEPVYKIDKYFNQLFNIEKFKNNVQAVILGDFIDCEETEKLEKLFYELGKTHNIPIYGGYQISHGKTKITVPIGGEAKLESGIIKVLY